MNDAKRVLYVENRVCMTRGDGAFWRLVTELRKHYAVDTQSDLDESVVERLRGAQQDRPYDALLTHFPCHIEGEEGTYGPSIAILIAIRSFFGGRIVIYTGALPNAVTEIEHIVDAICHKSDFLHEDAAILRRAIEGE